MADNSTDTLREISQKMDMLIALFKISNRDNIKRFSAELAKDPIYSKILELSLQPISYGNLSKTVAEANKSAEITVKKKVSELKEMGALSTRREGREVFYENTGLLG